MPAKLRVDEIWAAVRRVPGMRQVACVQAAPGVFARSCTVDGFACRRVARGDCMWCTLLCASMRARSTFI